MIRPLRQFFLRRKKVSLTVCVVVVFGGDDGVVEKNVVADVERDAHHLFVRRDVPHDAYVVRGGRRSERRAQPLVHVRAATEARFIHF